MSAVLFAALALTLGCSPPEMPLAEPAGEAAIEEGPPPQLRGSGTIVLAPTQAGEYRLFDNEGQAVGGAMQLGAGQAPRLQLAEGVYHVHGPAGIDTLVVGAGLELAWDGQRVLPTQVWEAKLAEQRAAQLELEREAAVAVPVEPPAPRVGNWRLWASPLGSTFVPGLGQFFNGQGGKGTGILFGAIGSSAAAGALYSLGNDGTRSSGAEYARLVGFGTLSTTAALLWIYGIADAYRVASGKRVEPQLDHKLRLSVTRMMTVGFRADERRPGFYDDWSVAIMGQATRRLTVGVSDLSVKPGGVTGPQVWQFGARLDYRVFDRKRLWIDLAVGSILQVAVGQQLDPLDPDLGALPAARKLGAAPYGQLDLRMFVLDRLSIDIVPRLTVPLTTRYYSVNRALPRFAPELELGAGLSAYF